ncbi:MAG TPA: polyprenyl synthetase family protein, partial [Opitutaceae bacterium]|nr:polyprenyl synthetase family protein [Opitutaceae bacterium]
GGQMEDMLAENSPATTEQLDFIHLNKTAAMIEASLVMGGLVGGANEYACDILRRVGRHVGLAFQIIDDILDATSDASTLGKTPGKDAAANKTTYVKLHGIEAAQAMAKGQSQGALVELSKLPGDITFLRELIETMLTRKH